MFFLSQTTNNTEGTGHLKDRYFSDMLLGRFSLGSYKIYHYICMYNKLDRIQKQPSHEN